MSTHIINHPKKLAHPASAWVLIVASPEACLSCGGESRF